MAWSAAYTDQICGILGLSQLQTELSALLRKAKVGSSGPHELREGVRGRRVRQWDREEKMGKEEMPGGLGHGRE